PPQGPPRARRATGSPPSGTSSSAPESPSPFASRADGTSRPPAASSPRCRWSDAARRVRRRRLRLGLGPRVVLEAVLDDRSLRGPDLVEPPDRTMMWRLLQQLRLLRRLPRDREHRVAEGVERL